MASYLLVLVIGCIAGCVGGVVGTGSSIILLPILVFAFGPKQAVPIMAVASVIGNLSRVIAWRHDVDWRAAAWYAIPGIPAAALGARTLLVLPPSVIDVTLGVFFLLMIPVRHWQGARGLVLQRWHLAVAGTVIGFITGVVLSTGPLSVPVFAAYGLTGGVFLSTEAASAVMLYVTKVLTFRHLGAMPADIFVKGLVVGASLMVGTWGGKMAVRRLSPDLFRRLLDGVMCCSGIALIWNGLR